MKNIRRKRCKSCDLICFATDDICPRCGDDNLAISREFEKETTALSVNNTTEFIEPTGISKFNFGTLAAIFYLIFAGGLAFELSQAKGFHSGGELLILLFLLASPWSWLGYLDPTGGILGLFVVIGGIALNAYIFHRLGARITAYLVKLR